MSGIFGIIKSSSPAEISSSLARLLKWNGVFGDEQKSEIISDSVGIGICADHITNAPINNTPVLHKDDYYAVIDALIYNRQELSSSFNLPLSLSDEEMLFELIIKNGPDSLSSVNGDFSGAIYDSNVEKLTLFTDHMGIHPLYYYKSDKMGAFSTEIRGLINLPEIPGDINPDYLYTSVCEYITSSLNGTEFSDIYRVTPASYLCITKSSDTLVYEEHKYWTLGAKKVRLSSDKKYIQKMRELITESIRKRLAVFPDIVGAELSGGIDSGVIDILISKLGREAIYFSWSRDPKDLPLVENDERLIIEDICKQENTTCYYRSKNYVDSNSNIINNHLKLGFSKDAPGSLNFKYAYPLYTNTEIINEASQLVSSKGAKVIFSGHGGDEGVSHRSDPYELYCFGEKLHFIKCLWEFNEGAPKRMLKTFRDYRYKVARGPSYDNDPMQNTSSSTPFILKKELCEKYKDYKGTPFFFPHNPLKYIATGATNIRLNVAALFGPYSGARYIFPFLDYEVINFAVTIPRHLYIKHGQKRYIYREAFKDIMPKSLYEVTYKNTPSEEKKPEDNEKEEDVDWFKDNQQSLKNLFERLDKDFWAECLDFNEISKLTTCEDPGLEGKDQYMAVLEHLGMLYQFQNIVTKVKAIS
ncbi:asparagine synthase-related protein [Butyrivibrio sp. VCB2006]|uniref:asparagine synthase-related protein n=1 Tax=Butyrivibrio sp. VCB2006 TaxID=1280679 RepID=UPI00040F9848|nr:asparagine synthase-related protein [Butyrivibrio sp. VCB2006]